MKAVNLIAAGTLVGATLMSTSALAGLSGNVGVVSEYMFRGVGQSGGAAVQGGLDYEFESGLYVGTWVSNISFGGGTEQDLYIGYATSLGEIDLDLSALYYWYPEEDESGSELSTLEFAVGVGFGPVTVGYALATENNFFIGDGNGEEAGYLSVGLSLPVSETLSFDAGFGLYSGDEIERFLASIGSTDDSYTDITIGLSTELEGGYAASFQYIMTDIDGGSDDDPKFVVGLSKGFDL